MKDKKKWVILGTVLLVLCIGALFLYQQFKPQTTSGKKHISVSVTHGDESITDFTYATNALYLGDILQEKGLIDGEMGDYGLYVKTVDQETADDGKQEWWCLTKDGEPVNTGVDLTPIANNDKYEFTLTVGY